MKARQYLCLVTLLTGVSCSNPKKAPPLTHPDGAIATLDTNIQVLGKPVPPKSRSKTESAASPQAGTWIYKETVGGTGMKTYTASVISADILTFEKPFDGGSTATLTVRKRNGSTTVSLSVSKGQFTSSFQGGQIRIRFDNSPSALYAFTAAANGNTDIIFPEPVLPLIHKLKFAKKTIFNVGFYGQGTRRIEFKTTGLTWKE